MDSCLNPIGGLHSLTVAVRDAHHVEVEHMRRAEDVAPARRP